jgi:peptidoglycan/LPS O-acetylase OafA/YrhL
MHAPADRSVLPATTRRGPADWRVLGGLAGMVAIALAWRIYYVNHGELAGTANQLIWLPGFLDWFAVGMALAWVRERPSAVPGWLHQLAQAPGVCWSLAVAGYWLGTTSIGGPLDLTGATLSANLTKHIIYALVGGVALLPAVCGEPSARWRRAALHPVMRWLGQVSFGIFLWHPMLLDAIRRLLKLPPIGGGGFWLTLVLTLIASGVVGTLSWRFVEAPLQRRWRNGFGVAARLPRRRPRRQPAGLIDLTALEARVAAAVTSPGTAPVPGSTRGSTRGSAASPAAGPAPHPAPDQTPAQAAPAAGASPATPGR